jgi:hypothetical protein
MSPEYYARLDQGRARNPSSEILEALARALFLDAAEREHLNDLCTRRERPGPTGPAAAGTTRPAAHSKRLATCRRSFSAGADVLAATPLACAVLTGFGRLPAVKRTLACGLSVYRS